MLFVCLKSSFRSHKKSCITSSRYILQERYSIPFPHYWSLVVSYFVGISEMECFVLKECKGDIIRLRVHYFLNCSAKSINSLDENKYGLSSPACVGYRDILRDPEPAGILGSLQGPNDGIINAWTTSVNWKSRRAQQNQNWNAECSNEQCNSLQSQCCKSAESQNLWLRILILKN